MKLARLALLALAGCEFLSTREWTGTRDMRLDVTIASADDGTHVEASLTGSFGDPQLGPNDTFAATIDGASLPLAQAGTTWSADTAARGGVIAFTLHHEGDYDATVSATLPAPSNVVATSIGGALDLAWTAQPVPGIATTITVSGTCITAQTLSILTDTGHYVIPAAALQAAPSSCPIVVTLARAGDETDSPFASPFLWAHVTQSESVQSTWNP